MIRVPAARNEKARLAALCDTGLLSTLSIGIAEWNSDADEAVPALTRRAEMALLSAKLRSRSCASGGESNRMDAQLRHDVAGDREDKLH